MLKNKKIKLGRNKGMTYVELIVVLGIVGAMTSVILFNYGTFQAKVDIRNLANDIALKIVEAQKSSMSGKLPASGAPSVDWKPSYGIYFDHNDPTHFIYFTDVDADGKYNNSTSVDEDGNTIFSSELPEIIEITKGNHISQIYGYIDGNIQESSTSLSITFKRPNSSAIFSSGDLPSTVDYIQITIYSADNSAHANIKIYSSGKVQIN